MTNALQYSAGTIYYFGKRLLMDQLEGACCWYVNLHKFSYPVTNFLSSFYELSKQNYHTSVILSKIYTQRFKFAFIILSIHFIKQKNIYTFEMDQGSVVMV
jgi:hypothetical protein